jgi:hypothetical protein
LAKYIATSPPLATADAAMTRANNAIIAAISIDLGSRRRLSKFQDSKSRK